MFNNTVRIRINGIQVASKQFSNKDQNKLNREVSNWRCDQEFNIRATMQACGVASATIQIVDDGITIEHIWASVEDSTYGQMLEGVVIN